jgi:hypothetical protein
VALREILARFGIQVDAKQLVAANVGIAGAIGSLKALGAAFIGSAIVRGASNFVKDIAATGDELGKTAAQLGIGVTELQRWRVAAQLTGASSDDLTKGLRTLAKNALASAQSASSETARAFESLGVSVKDTDGNFKDTQDLLRETGSALSGVESNLERTALAQQLFGRAGTKLLPLFAQGEEGLEKLLEKLDEFGGGFGEDAVKMSEDLTDAFLGWDVASTSLKSAIAVGLLPVLTFLVNGARMVIASFSKLFKNTNILRTAVTVLGGFLANLGFSALARIGVGKLITGLANLAKKFIPIILRFALMFLLVDDFITLIRGGDSLIGRFLDKIFGEGTAAGVVKAISDIGSAVSDFLSTGNLSQLDDDLEAIFGPPGQALVEGAIQIFDDVALAIGKFIVETATAIDTWLRESMASVRGGITDFAAAAVDLGAAIVEGIIKGIADGAAAVVQSVKDMATGAVDAAKAVFRPGSPAKTFITMGRQNMQGLVVGQEKEAKTLSRLGMASMQTATGGAVTASVPSRAGGVASGSINVKSEMNVTLQGGAPNDPQLQKLRQGLRSELSDNRRSMIAALVQQTGIPA